MVVRADFSLIPSLAMEFTIENMHWVFEAVKEVRNDFEASTCKWHHASNRWTVCTMQDLHASACVCTHWVLQHHGMGVGGGVGSIMCCHMCYSSSCWYELQLNSIISSECLAHIDA